MVIGSACRFWLPRPHERNCFVKPSRVRSKARSRVNIVSEVGIAVYLFVKPPVQTCSTTGLARLADTAEGVGGSQEGGIPFFYEQSTPSKY